MTHAYPSFATRHSHLLPFMVAMLVSAIIWVVQPLYTRDKAWSDHILSSQNAPVTTPVLVVEIDARDIGTYGGPPIGRDILAQVLDRLNAEGASRILVDMLFTGPTNAQADQLLADALQRLGPQRVAMARDDQVGAQSLPLFAGDLPQLDTRLSPDRDGWFRSIRAEGSANNPALWLATGQLGSGHTPIDLRYDPASVEIVSVNELLTRAPGGSDVEGRLVVITQSTQIGAANTYLPGYGAACRGVFMVLGASSYLNGYAANADYAQTADLLLAILALIGGYLAVSKSTSFRVAALYGMGGAMALCAGNWVIISTIAGAAIPFTSLLILLTSMVVALFQRTRMASVIGVLMKGDMSPEEAWDWRAHGVREEPVFLFAANGEIKRLNPAAQAMVSQLGVLAISSTFLSGFGVRDDRVRIQGRVYALEWPNPILPLVIARDVTDAAEREQALQVELITDALTGLLNRAGFDKRLEKAANDKRYGYALFYLDMNGFKAVNDTHGHDAGDDLLRVAAEAFTGCVRERDSVARLGGDEFAILCPGTWSQSDAQRLADDLEASLKDPVALETATVKVGVAVGFAMPEFVDEPYADVVKRADQAMYARKAVIKQGATLIEEDALDALLTSDPDTLLSQSISGIATS